MITDKTINAFLKKNTEAPYYEILGMKLIKSEKGMAVMELDAKQDLTNGIGIIHGGVTASLCDTVMGVSAMTLGINPVTVEMKLNYLAPGSVDGKLIAKGKVVKAGRTLVISEGEVYHKDKLIAKSLGTYYVKNPTKNAV